MSKKLSISKAIGEALHEEMARDENVIIMGEDMGKMGNVFGITVGFQEEFGENRVFDTPISESGFCGMAVGAAMRGIRPVVELMYDDFICGAVLPVVFSQKVAAVFACAEGRALRHAHCRARVLCRLPDRHLLRADVCFNHCAQPDSGCLRQRTRCGDRHRVQSEYVHHLPANGPCKRCTADFRLQLRCG